jgi:hypothetical protein
VPSIEGLTSNRKVEECYVSKCLTIAYLVCCHLANSAENASKNFCEAILDPWTVK